MSEFSRRGFLRLAVGFAAAEVASQIIPFDRVWSFPSNIKVFSTGQITEQICAAQLEQIRRMIPPMYDNFFVNTPFLLHIRNNVEFDGGTEISDVLP